MTTPIKISPEAVKVAERLWLKLGRAFNRQDHGPFINEVGERVDVALNKCREETLRETMDVLWILWGAKRPSLITKQDGRKVETSENSNCNMLNP